LFAKDEVEEGFGRGGEEGKMDKLRLEAEVEVELQCEWGELR
jgi:hypothetical protein